MSEPQYIVTEAIRKALGYQIGELTHEGREIRCAGVSGTDANGLPIVTDRHLIATLDDHMPGTQAHAWGNKEFTDDLWLIDSAQTGIDWSNPTCRICGKGLAP